MANFSSNDFERPVWCLLGLPFDAVELSKAAESIRQAASGNLGYFVSTPNLNFTVAALNDSDFRDTVIRSELSLVDGMPLLWIARLLGTGLTHKVSGSDLFDVLRHQPRDSRERLKVFFFGGEPGVAETACATINASDSPMHCVGFLNPGFGSMDELSEQNFIDQINESQADFLVVSLGANKGQFWIDRNRSRLNPPVISHLGAVVNFVAGKVKRAPLWMQKSGLEWLWRIQQEPVLWKRYYFDGLSLLGLFFTRVLPYAVWRQWHADRLAETQLVECRVEKLLEEIVITINGSCLHQTIAPLRTIFRDTTGEAQSIRLDLSGVPVVDGAFLGLCLVLVKRLNGCGGQLKISGLNSELRRIFRWNCVEYLL